MHRLLETVDATTRQRHPVALQQASDLIVKLESESRLRPGSWAILACHAGEAPLALLPNGRDSLEYTLRLLGKKIENIGECMRRNGKDWLRQRLELAAEIRSQGGVSVFGFLGTPCADGCIDVQSFLVGIMPETHTSDAVH